MDGETTDSRAIGRFLFPQDQLRWRLQASFEPFDGLGSRRLIGKRELTFRLPTTFGACAPHKGAAQKRRIFMKTLAQKVQRFLVSEDGPTAVEYAVMLALIIIVCLTAIRSIGTNAASTFNGVAAQLGS
jgi:pilus assembly protein Flp/PilA